MKVMELSRQTIKESREKRKRKHGIDFRSVVNIEAIRYLSEIGNDL